MILVSSKNSSYINWPTFSSFFFFFFSCSISLSSSLSSNFFVFLFLFLFFFFFFFSFSSSSSLSSSSFSSSSPSILFIFPFNFPISFFNKSFSLAKLSSFLVWELINFTKLFKASVCSVPFLINFKCIVLSLLFIDIVKSINKLLLISLDIVTLFLTNKLSISSTIASIVSKTPKNLSISNNSSYLNFA